MTSALICSTCGSSLTTSTGSPVCAVCVLRTADAALGGIFEENDPEPRASTPRQFGDYDLIGEIGHGGMGLVFKARQRSLGRIVALKLLLTGRFSDEHARRRFQVEAESAARLQHPNIVAIHDVGEADGHPYLTMEFVEGRTLAELCDGVPIEAKTAARYVRDIARAIQAAHAAGILHRDLKPSNVLIGADDRPRVTDFGLARRMDGADGALTVTGQVLASPNYAAPEQAAGKQELISAATDVYGLGALLYHLITGRAPFEAASAAETLRLVLDTEPMAPRTRNPGLPRDLETIGLKCLRKEPRQRYASAAEVADECDRFLAHRPIQARPVSTAETLWRWCQRRPATATLAATVVILLLGLAIGGPLVALRLARAQARAEAERVRAESEAATSKAVSDFLQNDLLAQASPDLQSDRDLKLRTVLDRAAKNIEGRFANQPLVEADVRETLATTYLSLGEFAGARDQWTRVRDLRQRILGPEHAKTLRAGGQLTVALRVLGRLTEAEALAFELLPHHRRVLGTTHRDTLQLTSELGVIYRNQGKHAAAEPLYLEALDGARRMLGAEDPFVLEVMNNLGVLRDNQGRVAEAEKLHTETLELRRRVLGAEHPDSLHSMHHLVQTHRKLGKLAQAEELAAEAMATRQRVLGPEHLFTLQSAIVHADVLLHQGRFSEAEGAFRQTIDMLKRKVGLEHETTITTMGRLGTVLREQKRLPEAGACLSEALAICQRVLGPAHGSTVTTMVHLARVHRDLRELGEAQRLAAAALAAFERTLGPAHPQTLAALDLLGDIRQEQGELAEAATLQRRSLDARLKSAPTAWTTAVAQGKLGGVLLELKRYEEAEPLIVASHATITQQADKIPPPARREIDEAQKRLDRLRAEWKSVAGERR